MIESLLTQTNTHQSGPQKVLKMVKNDRMSGYVPKWAKPTSAQETIEARLSNAQTIEPATQNALAYNHTPSIQNQNDEFGFADLIDMVNPLHHVPVVGHLYREMTGDEIKPIGKIMGGAVFGGAIGAASGLVNVIIEEETGQDIAGNAMTLAFGENVSQETVDFNAPPEKRIESALNSAENLYDDEISSLALLSFSDLGHKSDITIQHNGNVSYSRPLENHIEANRPVIDRETLQPREPITEITFSEEKRRGLYAL